MRAESPEKEIEGEREEEGGHDCPESDAGEVDGPVGGGDHETSDKAGSSPVEELFAEQVETECGQCAENDGEDLESDEVVAEYPDGESLKIDEESFAAEIGRVEEIKLTGLDSMERIDAVGCFIGVESDRNRVEVIDTKEECESE